jgi:hypothetical protein
MALFGLKVMVVVERIDFEQIGEHMIEDYNLLVLALHSISYMQSFLFHKAILVSAMVVSS